MKKLSIVFGLVLVLLAAPALALPTITYHFNTNNVQVEAYNCLDAACNTVEPFSGSFPDGQSTTNGQIRIQYPAQLARPDGYAIFYFAHGALPKEGRATWYGDGTADFNVVLNKITQCSSVVDTLTVTNDAHANVPLVVNTASSLDAITRSAFELADNLVGYVPPAYAQEFYAADTIVTLKTTNAAGAVVDQQQIDFTAANGDAIFAGDNRPVQFSWTPHTDGRFTSTITTTVMDNQCLTTLPQSASSTYSVLPALPQNECYTILNGLAANPSVGTLGQPVALTFTKISNHANNYAFNGDPNWRLLPVPTDISYSITGPGGTVAQSSFSAPANADNSNPSTQTFSFTPTQLGMNQVVVTGTASSPLCAGLINTPNTVTLNINVQDVPRFNVRFQLVDQGDGSPLAGATITIGGQSYISDAQGKASTGPFIAGDYAYSVGKTGYVTLPGTVHVTNVDIDLLLTIQRVPVTTHGSVRFEVHNGQTQAPLQGASVNYLGSTVTTDVNGVATFADVAAGTNNYQVSASGFDAASGTVTTDGTNDQTVRVGLTPIVVQGTKLIRFHAYNFNTGADLGGVTVTVTGPGLPPNGATQGTDATGHSDFTVQLGTFTWSAERAGFQRATGGVSIITDTSVDVAMIPVTAPTFTVTYHVIDAQTGAAISGAPVVFNGVTVVTDVNGNAVYPGTANGGYQYSVSMTGYVPVAGTTQVTDNDVTVTVPLTRTGTVHQVTFHVADANTGINLPGVAVTFDGRAGTTDNNGRVVFNNVPDNSYTYTATLNGYMPVSGSFTVAGADVTVEVRMAVMAGTHTVTVHVYDHMSNANLPGAFVRFDGQQGTTDINGLIVFRNVPAGSFPWDVTLAGYDPAAGTLGVNGDVRLEVPLHRQAPPPTHTATFNVIDATSGLPIRGATIAVGTGTITTNANGIASIVLADGSYTFIASASGYNSVSSIVTLAGSDVTVLVRLGRAGGFVPLEEETRMGIFIGSIRVPEIGTEGGEVPIVITFKNDGDVRLEGVRAVVVSQDLGLRAVIGPFDLGHNDQVSQRIILDTEGVALAAGLYPIRLTVSNDDLTRVVYRDLEVLP